MELIADRYHGVTIDYSDGATDFEQELTAILKGLDTQKLLWITVPIEDSELVPLLTRHGFVFYECGQRHLTMVKKLVDDPVMPTATNHTLGVGAAVLDGDQLLVVRDRFYDGYKLPGGHVESREHISEAMAREVLEETGIEAAFQSIVSLGHFFPGQFAESNLYIVCRGEALSKEISIQDSDEIAEAKWVGVKDYLGDSSNAIYNRMIVEAALQGDGLTMDERELPQRGSWSRELFFM